jgi:DNA-binding NarL/FixJ family response regulator
MQEAGQLARGLIASRRSQLPLGSGRREQAPNQMFLTPVLLETLSLLADGATIKEAARMLGVPVSTVQGRRARILEETGCASIYDAVQKARKAGLL